MRRLPLCPLACALLLASFQPAARAASADPDPTFGTDGVAFASLTPDYGHHLVAHAVIALPDGRILAAGYRNKIIDPSPDPHALPMLTRLDADGTPDATFGDDPANPGVLTYADLAPGTAMQQFEAIARLPDGTFVLAGTATAFGPTRAFIVKVGADGRLDGAFGTDGVVTLPTTLLHALAIDSHQRIVVAGEKIGGTPLYRGIVLRFNADGTPDPTFSGDGRVELVEAGVDQLGYIGALALLPDDRIVTAGSYQTPDPAFLDNYDFSVARFTADGALDATFASDGWSTFQMPAVATYFEGVDRLLADADGALTLAGHYADPTDAIRPVLVRLDAGGAPVPTFGDAATPGFRRLDPVPTAGTQYVSALLPQPAGGVLYTVTYSEPGVDGDFVVGRTDATGAGDPGFGTLGVARYDLARGGAFDDARALTVHQGKPLVVGVAMAPSSTRRYDLAALRLTGDDEAIFGDGYE